MTDQEKRIKIFEATGWKFIPPVPKTSGFLIRPENCQRWRKGTRIVYIDEIPEYPRSLDAMAEAEKVLTVKLRAAYMEHLFKIAGGENRHCWTLLSATAPQRFEAFGKTLNLW